MAAKKRPSGMGSVYQRKDGKYCAQISLGTGPDGKRKRKYVYGDSSKEVVEQMKKLLRDQQQGKNIAPARQTVESFLTTWLEETIKPNVRPTTYVTYRSIVNRHLIPTLGKHQLTALGPQHIQKMMNDKLAEGLSTYTVRHIYTILKLALRLAVTWSFANGNVADLVSPPRLVEQEVQPLNPEQARRFLEAIKGHRMEALYSVVLALGLRRGEALGLRWQDVDLDKGSLCVRVTLQRIEGRLQLVEPKTTKSKRTFDLPPAAIKTLRAHRLRQLEERLHAGADWQDQGLVFTSLTGAPFDLVLVHRHFKAILKEAGLPLIRFHDLRHTCATLLLVQGVHPRVVMDILGHSKISETMNRYSHVLPGLQKEALTRLGDLLEQQN